MTTPKLSKLELKVMRLRRQVFEEMGVKFRMNCEIGRDIQADDLLNMHDALFFGTGTYTPVEAQLPGMEAGGIVPALPYLIGQTAHMYGLEMAGYPHVNLQGEHVMVLGGGDTAMDCVRTAVRQQAQHVICAYRRDAKNMPGSRREVKNATQEGVEFRYNVQPTEIVEYFGQACGVKTVRTKLGPPGEDGRRRPQPVPGSEEVLEADAIIIAFGFQPSPADWFSDIGVELNDWNGVVAPEMQEYPFQTTNPKIFAGGDMVRGSDLVVTAIWEGRQAAEGILDYLDV